MKFQEGDSETDRVSCSRLFLCHEYCNGASQQCPHGAGGSGAGGPARRLGLHCGRGGWSLGRRPSDGAVVGGLQPDGGASLHGSQSDMASILCGYYVSHSVACFVTSAPSLCLTQMRGVIFPFFQATKNWLLKTDLDGLHGQLGAVALVRIGAGDADIVCRVRRQGHGKI